MKHNTQTSLDGVLREGKRLSVDSLIAALHQISDPRKARGVRYPLVELLVLLILAKLGGEDNLKGMAEWVRLRGDCLKRRLKLERNSLSHQTTYDTNFVLIAVKPGFMPMSFLMTRRLAISK